jgi:hypothetical protein
MSAGRVGAPPAPFMGWLHLGVIAAVFAALFGATWGRWPDVLIDFGRELYVPWRIVEGERLFADLAWFNGPLSPHWNALMFRVFGVGLATLVWVNAAIFAGILALLHFLLREIASPVAATLACLVVMASCGFAQLFFVGNYNFICPYSHEATHGVLLGLGALAAAQRWSGRGSLAWLVLCGSCVGLAFLTKPEVFVAALAGACVAIALHAWSARASYLRAAGAFALGVVVPIAASWALLRGSLGSGGAWTATLGAWPQLFSSTVAQQHFYRVGMGLEAPVANLTSTLAWTASTLALFAPSAALALWARGGRRRFAAGALAAIATTVVFAVAYRRVQWLDAARPWAAFALVACVLAVWATLRMRGSATWPGAAGFAAFSLAMLAKILLYTRLYHYGFALALPATALVVVAAWTWVPARVDAAGGAGSVLRAAVAAALACFAAIHVAQTVRIQAGKTVEVGTGADRFLTDARGVAVNEALQWIDAHHPAGAPRPSLAVFPEGVMLNYLARLDNPTPYFNFMPPEIVLFGEARTLAAFRAHPPDLVLLAHKDTTEYGARWFGRNYATELGSWLQAEYQEIQRFGDPPLQPGSRAGIAVLVRRSAR